MFSECFGTFRVAQRGYGRLHHVQKLQSQLAKASVSASKQSVTNTECLDVKTSADCLSKAHITIMETMRRMTLYLGKIRTGTLKPNFTLILLACVSPQLSISGAAMLLLHLASSRKRARKIWVLRCPHTCACVHGGGHTHLIQELGLGSGVSCLSLLIAVMFLQPSLICHS